jgi:hypothetical protein
LRICAERLDLAPRAGWNYLSRTAAAHWSYSFASS